MKITYFRHRGKQLIVLIIIFLLFIPPLFGGGKSYFIPGLFLICSSLLLILFYILSPEQKYIVKDIKNNWRIAAPFLFWGLFLFTTFFTIFSSTSVYKSIDFYILLLAYFVLFFVISQTMFSIKEIRMFVLVLLFSALVLSLIGISHYLLARYNRVMSTFYWPNPFAGYLLLILPLSVGLFFKSKKWAHLAMCGAVAILLVSVFVLTESRASYLSFIIPFLILVWIFRRISKREMFIKLTLLLSGVFILVTFIFSVKMDGFSFFSLSKSQIGDEKKVDVGTISRLMYWRGAFKIFKDHPWLGSGLNTFGVIYPLYQESPLSFAKYTHNHYLQMLSEVGIFGAIPFFLLITSLLVVGRSILKPGDRLVNEERLYMMFFFSGILGSIIHSGADFDWYYPANFITFWIIAGLLYGFYIKSKILNK